MNSSSKSQQYNDYSYNIPMSLKMKSNKSLFPMVCIFRKRTPVLVGRGHFGGSGQWLKRKINTDHLLSKHLNNDKCPNIVKLITQYLNVLTIAKSRRLLQCRQFYMKNIPDCISLLSLLNHICIEKFKIFIFLLCHILKRIFYILLWFESQHENPHYIMGILLIWPPFPSLYNTFLGTQYG